MKAFTNKPLPKLTTIDVMYKGKIVPEFTVTPDCDDESLSIVLECMNEEGITGWRVSQ